MKLNKILIISLIVFVNANFLYSQTNNTIKKSEKIEIIDGNKYYIHKVDKGQTIYSISKAYGLNQDDIIKNNPSVSDGLKLGQELKIPVIENKPTNDNYIYHTVEKGQTAYSISKKYGITLDELFALNPEAKDGLNLGQKLKIKKIEETNTTETISKPKENHLIVSGRIKKDTVQNNYLKHKVKKKETLYSISKLYDVNVDDIYNANPSLKQDGLKKGTIINIPSKEFLDDIAKSITNADSLLVVDSISIDTADCSIANSFDKQRVLKIGLILPFELDIKTFQIEKEKNEIAHKDARLKTKPFFEFYQGLLLSLKEFKENNISVDLYVYNSKKSPAIAKSIILKPEIKQLDFIIGPIYKNVFDTVLKYKPATIPIINPLIDISGSISDNDFIMQNKSSKEQVYNKIIEYISGFEKPNYIIVHGGNKFDVERIAKHQKMLQESFANPQDSVYIKLVNFNEGKLKAIKNAIVKDRTNIVIMPSTNQGFVTNVITNLHVASVEDSIILIGMEEWLKYNIEVKYYHSLNLTIFENRFIDYNKDKVIKFQKDFIDEYDGVPSVYSFIGYDTFNYYTNAFMLLNDNFAYCLDKYEYKGLIYKFLFNKKGNSFINNGLHIKQYKKDLTIEIIEE